MEMNWIIQNRELIEEELEEIRWLLAKAENIICSNSNDIEFCQHARSLKMIVHDTPDPHNIKRGSEYIQELLEGMKEKDIEGYQSLNKDYISFMNHSKVMRTLQSKDNLDEKDVNILPSLQSPPMKQPTLVFEEIVNSKLIQQANSILIQLHHSWKIGPHFMPLPIYDGVKIPSHINDTERLFSRWSDSAYLYAVDCIKELVGFEAKMFFGPNKEGIEHFNILRASCEIALERKDNWAPSLIRLLIAAAQELRRGGGTGSHGSERLRAKLIVGRLIGKLCKYDLPNAIELAELTIESISFSRSQIVYEQKNNSNILNKLIEQWSKKEERHPMRLDIIAQAFIFMQKFSEAKEILLTGKDILFTAQSECYSSSRGEYYEDTYTGILKDIYLARLTRTLSIIDAEEAFLWCQKISTPLLNLSCHLICLFNAKGLSIEQIENEIKKTRRFSEENDLLTKNLSLPKYELTTLAKTAVYPDFPAEKWEDLIKDDLISYESMIKMVLKRNMGFDDLQKAYGFLLGWYSRKIFLPEVTDKEFFYMLLDNYLQSLSIDVDKPLIWYFDNPEYDSGERIQMFTTLVFEKLMSKNRIIAEYFGVACNLFLIMARNPSDEQIIPNVRMELQLLIDHLDLPHRLKSAPDKELLLWCNQVAKYYEELELDISKTLNKAKREYEDLSKKYDLDIMHLFSRLSHIYGVS